MKRHRHDPFVVTCIAFAMLFVSSVAALGADAVPAKSAVHIFQWRPFLGPFHSLVLHYPIGFLTMAFILEIYRLKHPGVELARVTRLVIWMSLLSGLVAAGLGIMRASSGGYEANAVTLHRAFGMAVPVMTLLTLGMQRVSNRDVRRVVPLWAYRALLLATLSLLVVAGHYGGNLTHGSKYLVQNAPTFVRELLEPESAASTGASGAPLTESQHLFVDTVTPAFNAKCLRCHGPEKQKGGYRLDVRDRALKGGESDLAAIKPGDPMHSNLLRLVMLPTDHDDAMPPEGKEPLTPAEIVALAHWIQAGAPWVDASASPLAGAPGAGNASRTNE